MDEEQARKLPGAYRSFQKFIRDIFPLSFPQGKYIHASHVEDWAKTLQKNDRTARLAPRGHMKSTTLYAYLMWRILRTIEEKQTWLYMSYTDKLAAYHIRNVKALIRDNPYFQELIDLTDADSIIKCSWDGKTTFEMHPASVTAFNRGWHGNVICDDILADPDNMLNLTVLNKINRAFFDEVLRLPSPEDCLHLVGTPQHNQDLFFQINERKDLMDFHWEKNQAIVNEIRKETLWPERYSYEMLDKMRKSSPRSFAREMMCEPVWDTNSFLIPDNVQKAASHGLESWNLSEANRAKVGMKDVVAGWDLGKKQHPSHFAVGMVEDGKLVQIYDKWMDRWDYTDQISKVIAPAINAFKIDRVLYDATRGELDALDEQRLLPPELEGVIMTSKEQHAMATQLEAAVNTDELWLINDQRTISELLKVNSELDAIESDTGHGDSFWSIAMMVKAWKEGGGGAAFATARIFH